MEGGTLYDAVRYDDPVPISEVIRKTYIRGLDLIPGNLELMEFEHETPAAIQRGGARAFFARVRDALDSVESDYDVVVIDCPPQLGFLTMSALSASSGVLVTVHPQMLDLMSMSQFLRMTADLLGVIRDAGRQPVALIGCAFCRPVTRWVTHRRPRSSRSFVDFSAARY